MSHYRLYILAKYIYRGPWLLFSPPQFVSVEWNQFD